MNRQIASAQLRVSFAAHARHERSLSTRKVRGLASSHIGTRDAIARLRRWDHWLLATRTRSGNLLSPGWERIPDPGLIVLGKVKAGIEFLDVPGAIEATIEMAQTAV